MCECRGDDGAGCVGVVWGRGVRWVWRLARRFVSGYAYRSGPSRDIHVLHKKKMPIKPLTPRIFTPRVLTPGSGCLLRVHTPRVVKPGCLPPGCLPGVLTSRQRLKPMAVARSPMLIPSLTTTTSNLGEGLGDEKKMMMGSG